MRVVVSTPTCYPPYIATRRVDSCRLTRVSFSIASVKSNFLFTLHLAFVVDMSLISDGRHYLSISLPIADGSLLVLVSLLLLDSSSLK